MCRTTSLTITRFGVGGREKKGSYMLNYYSQSDSCIVALLPSPQGRYWIQIQTTILDTNPTQAGSYRRQEQVRKRENDRGYGDRRLEREGENVGVMLRLECIPDKQLESLFDCDEGTYWGCTQTHTHTTYCRHPQVVSAPPSKHVAEGLRAEMEKVRTMSLRTQQKKRQKWECFDAN